MQCSFFLSGKFFVPVVFSDRRPPVLSFEPQQLDDGIWSEGENVLMITLSLKGVDSLWLCLWPPWIFCLPWPVFPEQKE